MRDDGGEADPFERLLAEASEALPEPSAPDPQQRRTRRRRTVIGALCASAVLGLGTIGGGLLLIGTDEASAEYAAPTPPQPSPGEAAAEAAIDERDEGSAERSDRAMARVDTVWAARVAEESGIPERALRAYAGAALTLAEEQPACGLGWNTLAAIGFVETAHGTIHGSAIDADGRALPRITGVPLDGTEFAAIPDTDGGRIDGDADWDRAVGPMQFIPQTWLEYGRDADGHGGADIDHIDDAALSAAELLCASADDLRAPEQWIAAVDAYNPSVAYNNDVVEAADYYASFE